MHLDPSDCRLGMSRESNPSGNNDSVPHLGSSSITPHGACVELELWEFGHSRGQAENSCSRSVISCEGFSADGVRFHDPVSGHVSSHGWTNGVQGWLQLQLQGIESFLLDYAAATPVTRDSPCPCPWDPVSARQPFVGGFVWCGSAPGCCSRVSISFPPGVVRREGDLVHTHRHEAHDQPIRCGLPNGACTVSQMRNGDRKGLGTSEWWA
jgi:hypothetical protein